MSLCIPVCLGGRYFEIEGYCSIHNWRRHGSKNGEVKTHSTHHRRHVRCTHSTVVSHGKMLCTMLCYPVLHSALHFRTVPCILLCISVPSSDPSVWGLVLRPLSWLLSSTLSSYLSQTSPLSDHICWPWAHSVKIWCSLSLSSLSFSSLVFSCPVLPFNLHPLPNFISSPNYSYFCFTFFLTY